MATTTTTTTTTVRSVCPFDCPDTCSLNVTLEEGRIVAVDGNPDHPVTKGAICNKVRQTPGRVYHPDRLLYPLRRIGVKGSADAAQFERISWEEAYGIINDKMQSTIRDH